VLANAGRHAAIFRQVQAFASSAARAAQSLPGAKDLLTRITSAVEAETLVAK
ncbi:unnamed protein product, partial [Prorocentrum cordatum]